MTLRLFLWEYDLKVISLLEYDLKVMNMTLRSFLQTRDVTDRRTDGRTYKASYRDARTHLKKKGIKWKRELERKHCPDWKSTWTDHLGALTAPARLSGKMKAIFHVAMENNWLGERNWALMDVLMHAPVFPNYMGLVLLMTAIMILKVITIWKKNDTL